MSFSPAEALDLLRKARTEDRLGHAYLVTGPRGSGKENLAADIFRLVNQLPASFSDVWQHPDAHAVRPESKSRRIVVDQIRELEHALHMKPSSGVKKMGVIFEADRMVAQASNAFLKTLEEPPANSLLLLLTATPEILLETILSRCLILPLQGPPEVLRTEWETELLQALSVFFARSGKPELPEIFGLVRDFQSVLVRCKDGVGKENDAVLKAETKHYKQATEGKWLEQREEQLEAQAEAHYQRERRGLAELLTTWWADVSRQQAGGALLDLPEYVAQTAWLAQNEDAISTLQRLDALEDLKLHLSQNINEPLALEAAFFAGVSMNFASKMGFTDYQAKYFAYELTKRYASDSIEKLAVRRWI